MARRWFNKWRKRRIDKDAPPPLYLLPEDLLFIISQYLTHVEVVMLMLSCPRFWNSRNGAGVFASIWQQLMSPDDNPRDLRRMTMRFYILRMLEYDGLLQRGSPSNYCCWGCMKVHEREDFPVKEFKKKVNLKKNQDYLLGKATRSCSLSKRYIWFGVCSKMSFAELRNLVINPHTQQRRRNGWIRLRDKNGFFFEACSSLEHETRWLTYAFPLGRIQEFPSLAHFMRHARTINIPLCSHIRIGDLEIIELYNRPLKSYSCQNCATTVTLEISQIGQHINVYVFRYVGSLRSPTDPVWMAQSHQTRDKGLRSHCRAFLNWYSRQYGGMGSYGRLALNRGFKKFKSKDICEPFKGIAFASPEWPEQGPKDFQNRFTNPLYAPLN
ncbi:hypothetical protein FQN54_005286 [Arachnomyces sp. PD_36]|nr:hypothetical protein FQN54_005286 [Arachnomyces sp. PD_36]